MRQLVSRWRFRVIKIKWQEEQEILGLQRIQRKEFGGAQERWREAGEEDCIVDCRWNRQYANPGEEVIL
jgi:hypothetical protein